MNFNVVLLDDVSIIQKSHQSLVNNLSINLDLPGNLTYNSSNFVFSTGFMQLVKDEIDFVIQCHEKQNISTWNKTDFVNLWQFEKYLDYEIIQLSGGWQKMLGLALFTNQISRTKVYFDSVRHLSDNMINLLINNIKETCVENVFFFEYDTNLLKNYNFKSLYFDGFPSNIDTLKNSKSESNYVPNSNK
jgi:hypothetical protein